MFKHCSVAYFYGNARSCGQKQTWKQPVDIHTDIIAVFHHSFIVFNVCTACAEYVTDMYRIHPSGEGQFISLISLSFPLVLPLAHSKEIKENHVIYW